MNIASKVRSFVSRIPDAIRGLILLLIVLVALVWIRSWLTRRRTIDLEHASRYSAFFSGRIDIAEKQPVRYRREVVGMVTEITRSVEALQLTVLPRHVPEVPEVLTLRPRERAEVLGQLSIHLDGKTRAVLAWNSGRVTVTAERTTSGGWNLQSSVPAPGIRRNGRPILGKAGEVAPLRAGDRLEFMNLTNGFELIWGDVDFHTRVEVAIDSLKFKREAREAGFTPKVRLAPGSRVVYLTGVGNPKPRLEIQPSLSLAAAAVHRGSAGKLADSPELVPFETADPLAAVASLTGYLTSPQGLRQPPANRAEQMVADLNLTAAEVSELAGQFNGAGRGEQTGVLLRLLLDEPGLRDVANITGSFSASSANLRAASASLASTIGWANAATRDTTKRGDLLHQLLGNGYTPLVSTLHRVDTLTIAANGVAARNSAKLDSTINSVQRLTARVAADSLKLDSTLVDAQTIVRKIRTPGITVTGVAIGVAILNGIKSLFR